MPGETPANLVPGSVRLLLLAVLIRWLLGIIEIRLPERVFWSGDRDESSPSAAWCGRCCC